MATPFPGAVTPFPGAVARLHLVNGRPVLVLAVPPVEAVPESLHRPGEIATIVRIGRGQTWPDRVSAMLASAALQQDGTAALVFGSTDDGMACASRIAHANQAAGWGGAA
jgi:hypothetical protein